MSFFSMPVELQEHIVSFVQPDRFTNKEIRSCARQLINISLVNKSLVEVREACSKRLTDLKKTDELVTKYSSYNDDYENPGKDYDTGKEFDPKGNPQLLDALFTGCKLPFARGTFKIYTPEIERDIKEIVRLTPQSMNCILGELRCRKRVPPLAAACHNENIPLHMIEFLLQQGADANATLELCCKPTSILDELRESGLNPERITAIKELFKRYGAV